MKNIGICLLVLYGFAVGIPLIFYMSFMLIEMWRFMFHFFGIG